MRLRVFRAWLNNSPIFEFEPIIGAANRSPGRVRSMTGECERRPAFGLDVPDGSRLTRGQVCQTALRLPGLARSIEADDAVALADELGLDVVGLG